MHVANYFAIYSDTHDGVCSPIALCTLAKHRSRSDNVFCAQFVISAHSASYARTPTERVDRHARHEREMDDSVRCRVLHTQSFGAVLDVVDLVKVALFSVSHEQ